MEIETKYRRDPELCRQAALKGWEGRKIKTNEQRFFDLVDKRAVHECWDWKGHINRIGYGIFRKRSGRNSSNLVPAHRFSFEVHNGAFDKSLDVCHSCDNRKCVNPAHLWLGSHKQNMQDMIQKGRGRWMRGDSHKRVKYSDELVEEVGKAYVPRVFAWTKLAAKFGISPRAVKNCIDRYHKNKKAHSLVE